MNIFAKKTPERIFLDYASSTPLLPEVRKSMEKYFRNDFYNPSAIYLEGKKIRGELNNFRTEIAQLLHVSSRDIIFTSGGTESDNFALLGVFEAFNHILKKPHFIISDIEHSAIIEAAKEIERKGGEITKIKVDEEGLVSIDEIKKSLKANTVLVSVMLANNEIGTIEPVAKIARIIKEYRKEKGTRFPYLHTDASQGANYLSVDLESLGVDMLTLDGGKIYGPRGSGVLAIRPGVEIKPIIFGGGQEKGLRGGTENMALISGFSTALKLAQSDRLKESKRLEKIKNYFLEYIKNYFNGVLINTPTDVSLPNIVSISIPNTLGEFTAIKLDKEGILISTGSSCGTFKNEGGSITIKSIGKKHLSESTLRFSFGRHTTLNEIKHTLYILKKIIYPEN